MSGHSHWATTRRKKEKIDAARGKSFTRIIKEIIVAARTGGGGDPENNPRLRTALLAAKDVNMPKENIKNAIMKGTGELPGVQYDEVTYEGYGPGGTAIICQTMTDNKNRTVSELRHMFSRFGGNMGEVGCVSWMFDRRGVIYIPTTAGTEDQILEKTIEAGGDDMKVEDDNYVVYTDPTQFHIVCRAFEDMKVEFTSESAIELLPQNMVTLKGKNAEQAITLVENLEEHDDVQKVYHNAEVPDEELANID